MRSSNRTTRLTAARRTASARAITVALAFALCTACAGGGLGRQAEEAVQQKAALANGLVNDVLETDPTLTGQALVDAANSAATQAGGSISDAEATDTGARLHIEFQATASNGGGWFSSEEHRVLCVDLLVTPETDPPTSLEDADCKETIPQGYQSTTLG